MSELQQADEIQETRLGDADIETSDIEAADIEAANILHQRLEGLDEESASEDDEIAIQQYLTQHNTNKENPAYVVRGADLMCNCGTNSRKFNLNQCHGVYIKDHAVVHDHDCAQGEKENITWFGVCKSGQAPDTENIKLIGGDNQEHTGKKCTPVIVDIWQNSYDKTQVVKNDSCEDGNLENSVVYNTVTMDSFLVCKYGGIIMPINSGQDRTVEDSEFVEGEEAHKRVLEGTEECEEEISGEEGCEDLLHMMIADEFKDREVSCHGSAFQNDDEEYNDVEEIQEMHFSQSGYQLLIELELGTNLDKLDYIEVDENGKIIAVRNHDVGDGGITVGVGIYVTSSNKERIEMLEELGVNWQDTSQWVAFETVQQAFNNISQDYENKVNNLVSKYNLSLSQNQYDALFLFAYNRMALFNEGGAVYNMIDSNNSKFADWREALLEEYKGLSNWNKFGNGWTNRIEDELELYFYGDYNRTH